MNDTFALEERDRWASHLAERGYVVVRGVLSKEQADSALSDMWSLMEALGTVRKSSPRSHRASTSWPPMLHGGMIQYLGHTELQWRLRELCAPVFSAYYGVPTASLASSFDGLCMMHGDRGYKSKGDLVSFLHTDQSPTRKGEWSIQGLVNLADGGPDDGGLVVVPGSHLEHESFFANHSCRDQKDDWYKFSDAERARYQSRAIKVDALPGDFLMWDSRTFHCNTVPARKGAIRACTYICMLPSERVADHIRVKRAKAFSDRRVSSHHPAEGFKMFPTLPRFVVDRDAFYGRTLALQRGFDLTPLQQSLVCG